MNQLLRKISCLVLAGTLCVTVLTGCGSAPASSVASAEGSMAAGADFGKNPIVAISREDGSGTRGAFTELFKLEEKQGDKKVDLTTPNAQITNSTGVMMTTVSGNENAMGYISLGSLDDTVKALKVDGTEPTTENVKNGSYKIARPFNVATKGDVQPLVKDFMNFIASLEGQELIAKQKYIGVNDGAASFKSENPEGKIVIAGSSSITPLMEALKEAYVAVNTKAAIEIQTSDSTTGMNSLADGICDIGMASRELKESELAKGLTPTVIARDGIAVIVNKNCPVTDIKNGSITSIYKGEFTSWAQVIG